MIREARRKLVRDTVKDSKDTSTIWRLLNTLTRGSPSAATAIPSSLTAETFNNHFLSVAETLTASTHNSNYTCSNQLSEFCEQRTEGKEPFSIPPLAVHEVGLLISKLPNKKSSGPDDINPQILKLSLPYIVESITHIYNLCIQQSTFPTKLKYAKVIPLPKTKDRSDPNNYRPISLLSVLSKPLERHVHKHLLAYLEFRNLLHPFQSGFRPQHSCHTALTRLVDAWLDGMNKSQTTGVVYLDFKKAFDLIDHTILIKKIQKYVNNKEALSFFTSYLTDRKQNVLVNGSYSSLKDIKYGVPQGSVLGPLLFCIFINDLPLHITCKSVQCDFFADDTSIHSTNKDIKVISTNLQHSLDEVSEWCHNNSMIVHPIKTKSMIIATRQKQQLAPLLLNILLKGSQIEQVHEHRLLGITIDSQLKWQAHMDTLCKTIAKNLFMLSKLKYFTDSDTRKLFYDAHIRSHIDYASTVWDGCSEVHLKRLNSLHRRAAKLILPDPRLTTDEKLTKIGFLPLKDHFKYNKAIFMFKVWKQTIPEYISTLFSKSESRLGNNRQLFLVPKTRIDIYKASLSFSGTQTWNTLPGNVKSASSLACFKASLFKYFSKQP